MLMCSGFFTFTHAPGAEITDDCVACHVQQQASYARSQMAQAASTAGFLQEWQDNQFANSCLNCHSPSRTGGVVCADCHGADVHNANADVEIAVCARCHDAPGENTLRSYRTSPAASRGIHCASCHLDVKRSGHEFIGPSSAGFMRDVMKLRLSVKKQHAALNALVQIRHSAGHALPGGSTGRAVWLLFAAYDEHCHLIHSEHARFGWLYAADGAMQDYSLPAGKSTVVEFSVAQPEKVAAVRVSMLYRFVAGTLEIRDARQILLAQKDYVIKQEFNSCSGQVL